ncbi:hypothetical protein L2089_11740 [Paenibacillus hunanensis]|uniref:hypothetical protein n=1 Tax=Paenibacillus hunanensis TaxID=539262 RepID=UPI0020266CDC|nr:hypothetical protein [Paenibacillus hunanensis]MCL9661361.1 hypothetical protein [Paenibacillus hunanensis]
MKKKIVISLLTTALLVSSAPFYAKAEALSQDSTLSSQSSVVFTAVPDAAELERQKQYELQTPNAWEIDNQGNKKKVPYIVPALNYTTQSFSDSNYDYIFNGWTLNSTKTDPKRFFVDKVSVENRSGGSLPLKYIQQQSVTTQWSVGANIEAEAEFKVSFLASLKAKLGGSYSYSKTTSSSTTIEAGPKNVPAGYVASYTKYRSGGYGAGQAAWRKYVKNSASQVGMYYTGETGWAVNDNATTIVYAEQKL